MAASALLTAHVMVEFGDGDASGITVEVDSRDEGYNRGKTSFIPGDAAFLLAFLPANYEFVHVAVSAGSISRYGYDTYEVEDYAQFANEDAASLRYPHAFGFSYRWVGNNLGILSVKNQTEIVLPQRAYDKTLKKLVPEYRIGVAAYSYTANCEVWKVSNVPSTVEQVMAFFVARRKTT